MTVKTLFDLTPSNEDKKEEVVDLLLSEEEIHQILMENALDDSKIELAKEEIDYTVSIIQDAKEKLNKLREIHASNEEMLQNDEVETLKVLEARMSVESITDSLGFSEKYEFISTESIDEDPAIYLQNQISLEEQVIKDVEDAVLSLEASFIDKLKKFGRSVLKAFGALTTASKSLIKAIDKAQKKNRTAETEEVVLNGRAAKLNLYNIINEKNDNIVDRRTVGYALDINADTEVVTRVLEFMSRLLDSLIPFANGLKLTAEDPKVIITKFIKEIFDIKKLKQYIESKELTTYAKALGLPNDDQTISIPVSMWDRSTTVLTINKNVTEQEALIAKAFGIKETNLITEITIDEVDNNIDYNNVKGKVEALETLAELAKRCITAIKERKSSYELIERKQTELINKLDKFNDENASFLADLGYALGGRIGGTVTKIVLDSKIRNKDITIIDGNNETQIKVDSLLNFIAKHISVINEISYTTEGIYPTDSLKATLDYLDTVLSEYK
jgi:hypothetical protein